MSAVLATLVATAHAGPLGPGIPVKQVAPPPVVIEGVRSLEVRVTGPRGPEIVAEIREALASTTRQANVSANDVAQGLVSTASEVGGAYVGGLVGGGLGGKVATGLTKAAGSMVAEEIENEPLVLDDGLKLDVFRVVPSGGDATLAATVDVADSARDFTKKEALTYDDGTFVKDEDGNVVYEDIPCRAVSVTVTFAWSIAKGGQQLHADTTSRQAGDERCGEDLENLASAGSLAEPLLYGWGEPVAARIAPSWRFDRLAMDKEPHLTEELKLVKAGAYDRALCGLRNATSFDAHDAAALLDQGVIHEAMGRFDEALALYGQALTASGDRSAAKAMTRADARKKDVATMERAYGLAFRQAAFDPAACPPMPEGRRVAVAKPTPLVDAAGATLTDLERGTRLFVVEEGGALLAVSLTDGTRGFVDPRRVK